MTEHGHRNVSMRICQMYGVMHTHSKWLRVPFCLCRQWHWCYILNSAFMLCSINHIMYIPCFMYHCFHVPQTLWPPYFSAHDNWPWILEVQNKTWRSVNQKHFTTKCSKARCVSIRFGTHFLLLVLWVRVAYFAKSSKYSPTWGYMKIVNSLTTHSVFIVLCITCIVTFT